MLIFMLRCLLSDDVMLHPPFPELARADSPLVPVGPLARRYARRGARVLRRHQPGGHWVRIVPVLAVADTVLY